VKTILVVEDEEAIRWRILSVLAEAGGYEILCAVSHADGRLMGIGFPREIDLLLSNVILDGGKLGSGLAAEIKLRRPRMGVILIDGKGCGHLDILQRACQGWEAVENPFMGDELITRIRAEIGGGMTAGG
jgi:DNA-binding NtrC family response regulator